MEDDTIVNGAPVSKRRAIRVETEATLTDIYGPEGLTDPHAFYTRVLEIAAYDTLSLENSVERNRVLVEIAEVALALREG